MTIFLTPTISTAQFCQLVLKPGLPQTRDSKSSEQSQSNHDRIEFDFINPSLYRRLGILPTASSAEIKKAYQRAAMRFHPDRNRDKSQEEQMRLEEIFKGVKYAYEVLSDAARRLQYDQSGNAETKSGPIYSYPEGYNAKISMQLWAHLRAFFEHENPLFASKRGDALYRMFKYDLNQSLEVRNYILEIAYGRKFQSLQSVILKYLGYAAQYPEFRKAILSYASLWNGGEKSEAANLAVAMNAEYFAEFHSVLKNYFDNALSFRNKNLDEKLAEVIDAAFFRLDDKPKMQVLAFEMFFNSQIGGPELPQSHSMLASKIFEGMRLNKEFSDKIIAKLNESDLKENAALELLAGMDIPQVREVVLKEFQKGNLRDAAKIKVLLQAPELLENTAHFEFVLKKVQEDWSNNRPPVAIELLARGLQIERSVGALIRIIENSYSKDQLAHQIKSIETLGSFSNNEKAEAKLKEIILTENSYYSSTNKQLRVQAIASYVQLANKTEVRALYKRILASTLDKDVKAALQTQLEYLELP